MQGLDVLDVNRNTSRRSLDEGDGDCCWFSRQFWPGCQRLVPFNRLVRPASQKGLKVVRQGPSLDAPRIIVRNTTSSRWMPSRHAASNCASF